MSDLNEAMAQGQAAFTNSLAAAQNRSQSAAFRSKPREAVTFLLEGREVPILSARISRSIDTVADRWSVEIAWVPRRDKALDDRIAPYTYCRAQIYIGQRLVNTGILYTPRTKVTKDGLTKTLECASFTADLVDSMMDPEICNHGQWALSTLYDIARTICSQHDIVPGISRLLYQPENASNLAKVNEPFDFVQLELTQKGADLLTKLAFQRGALITNDRFGQLLITMGAKSGSPVATLGEEDIRAYLANVPRGSANSEGWEAEWDGRERFGTYAVYGQSGDPEADQIDTIEGISADAKAPAGRRNNIIVTDNTMGDAGIVAAWHRSQKLVKAMTIPFPVIGFYTPDGALWNPNDFVVAKAPSLDIYDPTRFLVRQIDYEHTAQGQTGTLYLVPPEVFTGQVPIEPWAGRWK